MKDWANYGFKCHFFAFIAFVSASIEAICINFNCHSKFPNHFKALIIPHKYKAQLNAHIYIRRNRQCYAKVVEYLFFFEFYLIDCFVNLLFLWISSSDYAVNVLKELDKKLASAFETDSKWLERVRKCVYNFGITKQADSLE